jgi:hypothetical protein
MSRFHDASRLESHGSGERRLHAVFAHPNLFRRTVAQSDGSRPEAMPVAHFSMARGQPNSKQGFRLLVQFSGVARSDCSADQCHVCWKRAIARGRRSSRLPGAVDDDDKLEAAKTSSSEDRNRKNKVRRGQHHPFIARRLPTTHLMQPRSAATCSGGRQKHIINLAPRTCTASDEAGGDAGTGAG